MKQYNWNKEVGTRRRKHWFNKATSTWASKFLLISFYIHIFPLNEYVRHKICSFYVASFFPRTDVERRKEKILSNDITSKISHEWKFLLLLFLQFILHVLLCVGWRSLVPCSDVVLSFFSFFLLLLSMEFWWWSRLSRSSLILSSIVWKTKII